MKHVEGLGKLHMLSQQSPSPGPVYKCSEELACFLEA